MKKFFKLSATFLVLGVLAVGCIQNESSQGIEAMRNAKATLLTAQATLVQAKAQVEAANAALVQAQATIVLAHKAIIDAQAAAIEAETEWQKALTKFHKEGWEIKIKEMEEDLRAKQAATDAAIAQWELTMAQLQADLLASQVAYEEALLAFEQWKLANIGTLAQDLIAALDNLTFQIQDVIMALGEAQVELNYAKAQYLWYTKVTYPEDVSHIRQQLEANLRRLTCEVEYLEGVVAAYDALYNNYHEDLDIMIADYQAMITAFRAEIAEMEIRYIALQEELAWFNETKLNKALAALTTPKAVGIKGVFSDGGDDINIHVVKGNYSIKYPWKKSAAYPITMFAVMERDMRVIEDTRAEFQDQGSGKIDANLKAKKDAAAASVKAYTDNWANWQKYYEGAQPATGALYTTWVNAWNTWDAAMKSYNAHLKTYDEMYVAADSLLQLFRDYMNGYIVGGKLVVPGSSTISEILGGIEFNATTLAQFVFDGNAQAFVDIINTIIGLLNLPTEIDAIVTQLKGLMDGTHDKGYPPFWEHATAWTYNPKIVPYGDIMRTVYTKQGKDLTQITKQDWYVWLLLYWMFEDRTVELGLDGPNGGPVITINPGAYKNFGTQVLYDFFGKLDKTAYDGYMVGASTKPIEDAIKAYYNAVEGLGSLEYAMFRPFNRTWVAYKDKGVSFSRAEANAAVKVKPALVKIASTPSGYTPPTYIDDPLSEEQPRPENVNEFFFKLELYKDETGPIPSLDFDITYLDSKCNLWVDYAALLAVRDNCGNQESDWVGDMMLWAWADKDDFIDAGTVKGHYFNAIRMEREAKAYQDTWNRVKNGEYAALIDQIQALHDAQTALYKEAAAEYKAMLDEYDDLVDELYEIEGLIPTYELFINFYQYLIDQAQYAHNYGNVAEDGLLSAWNRASHRLINAQNELNRVTTALEVLDEEYLSQAPIYQAQIDVLLEEINNLQIQMTVLEALRDKLLAAYL